MRPFFRPAAKIVSAILASACIAAGAPIKSLSADFFKRSRDASGEDSVSGWLYFRSPSEIYMTVRSPVEQSFYLADRKMVIQYPRKKLAMSYTSRNAFSLPWFHALMGAMEGEGAIARTGFALAATERRGDTTFSEWIPRKGGRKEGPIATLKVVRSGGRLLEFAAYDQKGVLKKKASYGDFRETGGGLLPCRIRTEEFDGKSSTVEEFGLLEPQVNPPTPPSVQEWRIPPDFTVKEFQW